jgi:small subunit ribosomal protein S1
VTIEVAMELVRAMLRDHGAWCRLEAAGRLFVHISYDQYLHIGSDQPCERAVARTFELGLFTVPVDGYDPEIEAPAEQRPADAAFWAELAGLVAERGAVLFQELFVEHASRWHRLTTAAEVEAVRARLAPRARLRVWPDLTPDVEGVLAGLPDDLVELVWIDATGRITSQPATDAHTAELRALLSGARAATVIPGSQEAHRPLLAAVLPDPDGVVRARWA